MQGFKAIKYGNARILAAGALILELVFDVITVAAGHHRQLGMHHCSFSSVQLPEAPVAVSHAVYEPGRGVTHLMNECVPEAICRTNPASAKYRLVCIYGGNSTLWFDLGGVIPAESQTFSDISMRA